MKDKQQLFNEYSDNINHILYEQHKGNIEKLSEKEQEIVRIWRLEADMYNGGFIQYFCNWGYLNFVETQDVLKKINAQKTFSILKECYEIISKFKDDNRINNLWDICKYLNEKDVKRLDELDKLYWEDPDDLSSTCYEFYIHS